jgi:hypothetical protein
MGAPATGRLVWEIPMTTLRPTLYSLVVMLVMIGLAAPAATAGVDVSFGASVRLDDDTDLFFAVSSRYFDRDRRAVDDWGRRFKDPDDLAVFLFLSKRSGKSPDLIFSMRNQGLSWWEVGARIGVPADAWFVPVRRDPGPPYGKAYGYWKKQRHDPRQTFVLVDADARNLVAVRMLHEYYGVSVETAMEWRASGKDLRALSAGEYRSRHGKGKGGPPGEGGRGRPDKGKGRG